MSDKSSTDFYDEEVKPVKERKVTLLPGKGKAVGLGVYKSAAPNPDFKVTCSPDLREEMGVSYERLDIPGGQKYMLLCQLHNFGVKACDVTVHLMGQAVPARA